VIETLRLDDRVAGAALLTSVRSFVAFLGFDLDM
jgi:hypothetical protein